VPFQSNSRQGSVRRYFYAGGKREFVRHKLFPPQQHYINNNKHILETAGHASSSEKNSTMPSFHHNGRCPILWSDSPFCPKPPPMPTWCLKPMQSTKSVKILEIAMRLGSRDRSIMNGGIFLKHVKAQQIRTSAENFHHFTLSQRNLWALEVLVGSGVLKKGTIQMVPAGDLPSSADLSTCAVVGSSGALLGTGTGEVIDQHTTVIRFNDAPTKGYETDVGALASTPQ